MRRNRKLPPQEVVEAITNEVGFEIGFDRGRLCGLLEAEQKPWTEKFARLGIFTTLLVILLPAVFSGLFFYGMGVLQASHKEKAPDPITEEVMGQCR